MQELESKKYNFFNKTNIELKMSKLVEKDILQIKMLAMWRKTQTKWYTSKRTLSFNRNI